ncbi:alpha/beta hydrolase family protein [Curtobacterium sp. VKM Ac-2922]|uniref:alpha/beta hydrolase n=1 Tax=Curtobacterium sp. VKM Ac-2922 TaxID=2929475 RepID=UPI001FB1D596|nr:alpha/beta hydrolase-fold protein [Curtobacterium sp. VKM Ac-2922]MCJ1714143.1 alpha/beta hydrolase-fold protein [Curtobacterium sp. VKM Ac-2922]
MPTSLTRRALLAGAGAVALGGATVAAVDLRVVPGRSTMFRVLGLDGTDGTVPDVTPTPTTWGSFVSHARHGRTVGWSITAPPSEHPLPVVVALHGYGDDHREFTSSSLGFDRFLAQHIHRGGAPFAIAAVDGGNRYWHRRADGEDPAGMVVDEFLPLLRDQGLDVDRLGFTGYSMGGYGALYLAGALGSGRVRVASALSPALWRSAGDTARGAFDDAADFQRNTVLGRQTRLQGVAVRVDCGTGDGFEPAVRSYVAGFAAGHRPAGGFEPGGHTHGYWRRLAPAHIAFLGAHLTA